MNDHPELAGQSESVALALLGLVGSLSRAQADCSAQQQSSEPGCELASAPGSATKRTHQAILA